MVRILSDFLLRRSNARTYLTRILLGLREVQDSTALSDPEKALVFLSVHTNEVNSTLATIARILDGCESSTNCGRNRYLKELQDILDNIPKDF